MGVLPSSHQGSAQVTRSHENTSHLEGLRRLTQKLGLSRGRRGAMEVCRQRSTATSLGGMGLPLDKGSLSRVRHPETGYPDGCWTTVTDASSNQASDCASREHLVPHLHHGLDMPCPPTAKQMSPHSSIHLDIP